MGAWLDGILTATLSTSNTGLAASEILPVNVANYPSRPAEDGIKVFLLVAVEFHCSERANAESRLQRFVEVFLKRP